MELGASQRGAPRCVVISPEHDNPRETAVLGELFAAGLERYHVRKPHSTRAQLAAWLHTLPRSIHARLVLHQHHDLASEFGPGGLHFRDEVGRVVPNAPPQRSSTPDQQHIPNNAPHLSRSCHDLATLRAALGRYDAVFFSPVFPSLSKPGYAPSPNLSFPELTELLAHRNAAERRTAVLALGGITVETAPRALALGFDGVAVLGAIWQSPDPVRAFLDLQNALALHVA